MAKEKGWGNSIYKMANFVKYSLKETFKDNSDLKSVIVSFCNQKSDEERAKKMETIKGILENSINQGHDVMYVIRQLALESINAHRTIEFFVSDAMRSFRNFIDVEDLRTYLTQQEEADNEQQTSLGPVLSSSPNYIFINEIVDLFTESHSDSADITNFNSILYEENNNTDDEKADSEKDSESGVPSNTEPNGASHSNSIVPEEQNSIPNNSNDNETNNDEIYDINDLFPDENLHNLFLDEENINNNIELSDNEEVLFSNNEEILSDNGEEELFPNENNQSANVIECVNLFSGIDLSSSAPQN